MNETDLMRDCAERRNEGLAGDRNPTFYHDSMLLHSCQRSVKITNGVCARAMTSLAESQTNPTTRPPEVIRLGQAS